MKRKGMRTMTNSAAQWPAFYAALFVVVVILIAATGFWIRDTRTNSDKTVMELCEFYLEEIAGRNVSSISLEIDKKATQMQTALTTLDEAALRSEQSVRAYLDTVREINGMDILALVDGNGMVYTADETFPGKPEFDFLTETITGTRTQIVRDADGRLLVLIAVPVNVDTGSGIRPVTCFTGCSIETVVPVEQLQREEDRTYCRLFTREGENLLNIEGDYPNESNLFDVWQEVAQFAPGYSLEKVKDDWQNGRGGYMVYSTETGGNTYVYYKPVPGTGMISTALMRESNISAAVKESTQRMLLSSIHFLLIVVIALLGLYYLILVVMRGVRISQREGEQFKIVGALSNDYSDIFLMDPGADKAVTMKLNGQMVDSRDRVVRSYQEAWAHYVQKYVLAEDAQMVLDSVAAEKIYGNLRNAAEYTLDYRADLDTGIHYYQAKFVKFSGEDGRLIVGIRNVDAQVYSENARQKVLRDALAAAQHANRAKTAFLNNMSHDIRTPMNAIIGFAALARAHAENPVQVREYLTKIQTASTHLMNLINDVLDMSRIESGKVRIEEQNVHLPDLVRDISTMVQTDIQDKQLRFSVEMENVVNNDVICDKLRLNQILLNLLSNAIKFTKPGGTVSLQIAQTGGAPAGYSGYEFRVKDTGIGMSREFQEHIFEAFTRERTSTVSGIQGTGLGMAITRSFVDIMGGTIRVYSEVDRGTEFVVDLQFRISGAPSQQVAAPKEDKVQPEGINCTFSGFHLLLVEDNALNREIAEEILLDMGFTLDTAGDGAEAVEIMRSASPGQYDLILMDIQMPNMDGFEATRRIRNLPDKELANIPIVAVTANAFEDDRNNAIAAGMNGHIPKPIEVSTLVETLRWLLKPKET